MAEEEPGQSRNLRLALYHANQLQKRKDIEMANLSAIEILIEFPANPDALASKPSSEDLAKFSRLVKHFSYEDFDNLVDERRCDKKCGYVFCPRPIKDTSNGAKFRLAFGNGELFIVPAAKFDTFCCKSCERRTMFLLLQFDENPAWVSGSANADLQLMTEKDEDVLVEQLKGLVIDKRDPKALQEKEEDLLKEMVKLAVTESSLKSKDEGDVVMEKAAEERNDSQEQDVKSDEKQDIIMSDSIGERVPTEVNPPTAQDADRRISLSKRVEDYQPKLDLGATS